MPQSPFTESGIRFHFPSDWNVLKYDEHRFYRYLSGAGLKGVDFIAIRNNEFILIEVKNYQERILKNGYIPVEVLMETPEVYVEQFIRKFKDTFRLLDIIEQYYHRKWWYRNIFKRFKSYFPESQLLKVELGFWSKAITLRKIDKQIKLVLWMELPPDYPREEAQHIHTYFQQAVQAKIPKEIRLAVVHSKAPFWDMQAEVS